MPKTRYYRGLTLPTALFLDTHKNTISASPSAQFDVNHAVKGQAPWQNTTEPAMQPKPRNLIITETALEYSRSYAYFFYWLNTLGFNCYLCISYNEVINIQFNSLPIVELEGYLRRCSQFNPALHYDILATQYQVPKDTICILNQDIIVAIEKTILGENRWMHIVSKYSEEAILTLLEGYASEVDYCFIFEEVLSKLDHLPYVQNYILTQYILINPSFYLPAALKRTQKYPVLQRQLVELHHDKIKSGYDLSNCLSALTQQSDLQRQLIKLHHDKIEYCNELVNCLSALTRQPDLQRQLVELHLDKIKEQMDLANCLYVLTEQPDLQRHLIELHHDKIKSGCEFVHCLSNLTQQPDLQRQLVKLYHDKIKDEMDLASFLFVLTEQPDLQRHLIELHHDKIKSGCEFVHCLSNLTQQPELQRKLVELHHDTIREGDELARCLSKLTQQPDLQRQLINWHRDKIKNSCSLKLCLSTLKQQPDLQRELVGLYHDKIKDSQILSSCLSALTQQPDLQRQLVDKHHDTIKSGKEFVRCLSALTQQPDLQRHLIKLHHEKIENIGALIFCLSALTQQPDLQRQLVELHHDKIGIKYYLGSYLSALVQQPDLQCQLVALYHHTIKEEHELESCLSALTERPDLQHQLVMPYHHKIKNANVLADCLSSLTQQPQLQRLLVDWHYDNIKYGEGLDRCLFALTQQPDVQKQLLQKISESIETTDTLKTVLKYSKRFPEVQYVIFLKHMKLLKDYKNLNACLIHFNFIDKIKLYKIVDDNMPQLINGIDSNSKEHIDSVFIAHLLESTGIHDLLTWLSMSNVNELSSNIPEKEITSVQTAVYLYISVDNTAHLAHIIEALKHHYYPKLAFVDIAGKDHETIKQLVDLLQDYAPTIREIGLPEACKGVISPHCFHYFFEKLPNVFKNHQSTTTASPVHSIYSKPVSHTLFVANSSHGTQYFDPDHTTHSHFEYIASGEILNGPSTIITGVRTVIYNPRNIASGDLSERFYTPDQEDLNPIRRYALLNAAQVDGFKRIDIDIEHLYCYATFTQTLIPGFNRLLSVAADETFEGMIAETAPAGVTLFYSPSDGFHYIHYTEHQPITINYVVKGKTKEAQEQAFERISKEHLLRQVIDTYRDPQQGFREGTLNDEALPTYEDFASKGDWLEAMYACRQGSCQIRTAAVEYALRKCLTSKDAKTIIRTVAINNNHDCLEILYKDEWILVDLGGSSNASESYLPSTVHYMQWDEKKVRTKKKREAEHEGNEHNKKKKLKYGEHVFNECQLRVIEPSSSFLTLQREVKQLKTPAYLRDIDTLNAVLDNPSLQSLLLICPEVSSIKNYCLKQLCHQRQSDHVYVVHNPQDFEFFSQLLISDSGEQVSVVDCGLARFLEAAHAHHQQQPFVIMIDWSSFDAKAKTQFNSLFDGKEGSINGMPVSELINIISLCPTIPDDDAFLFRHAARYQVSTGILPVITYDYPEPLLHLDCCGLSNWQDLLLGQIALINNTPVWQKIASTIQALSKVKTVHLINLPESERQACEQSFALAKARGYYDYHGYHIPLDPNISVRIDTVKALTITEIATDWLELVPNATAQTVPDGVDVLNSQLFDYIFSQKEMDDGVYRQTPGYLQENTPLSLWLTHDLTDIQWYTLLKKAHDLNIILTLYLAPNLNVPEALLGRVMTTITPPVPERILLTAVTVSTKTPSPVEVGITNAVLDIRLEDITYADLVGELTFTLTKNQFKHFEYQETDFVKALRQHKPIVLRGRYTASVLEALAPLLAGKALRLPDGSILASHSKIMLYLEKEAHDTDCHDLDFLGTAVNISYNTPEPVSPSPIVYQETAVLSDDLQDSDSRAKAFLRMREQHLIDAIETYRLISLVGPTGVGKTKVMQRLSEASNTMGGMRIYYDVEAWVNDQDAEYAVLFWDETNICNLQLTFLEPLKGSGEQQIYYQGKSHTLGPQHRVVFAYNPVSYGGGRVEQQLFKAGDIPELHFAPLPPVVIYEFVLKPLYQIYAGVTRITEAGFKEYAAEEIQHYLNTQDHTKNDYHKETVRELEQKVIDFLIADIINQKAVNSSERLNPYYLFAVPMDERPDQTDYINLEATDILRGHLQLFIEAHQAQHQGMLPNCAGFGLPACYLEGKPGIGKSRLVRHMLEVCGYQDGTLNRSSGPQEKPVYWVVNPHMSLQEQTKILIRAFERGDAVILDELNTTISSGLERILNAVLSGVHPVTGQSASTPGFMAFFTGNSIALSGRDALSPALRHRMQFFDANVMLTQQDLKNVVTYAIKDQSPDADAVQAMAQELHQLISQHNIDISLRMLFQHANEWYTKTYQPSSSCHIGTSVY